MSESVERGARRILGRTVPELAAWAVALLVLVVFFLQNRSVVRVRMLLWTVETPLIWALLVAAALGFLLGAFRIRITRRG